MRIRSYFIILIITLFISGCGNNSFVSGKQEFEEQNQLTDLFNKSENNNIYVIRAKNHLMQIVGKEDFNDYIIKHNITACNEDNQLSACVLNFYLANYYQLKNEKKLKSFVEETKDYYNLMIKNEDNIAKYCQYSNEFMSSVYSGNTDKLIDTYGQLFKLNPNEITEISSQFVNDQYTHFLIKQNPTVIQELQENFTQKCLKDPATYIFNYSHLFR